MEWLGDDQKQFHPHGLRLKRNESIRISLSRFPIDYTTPECEDLPNLYKDPVFSGCYRHYVPPEFAPVGSEGGYVICKGRKNGCEWCEHSDDYVSYARFAVATIVVAWPTNSQGVVNHRKVAEGVFDVMPWVFSRKVFAELSILKEEFPLGQHDLILTCDREKFQRIQIRPARDNLYSTVLKASRSSKYWGDKGVTGRACAKKMAYYSGVCSTIIQDTEAFTKALPQILGLENL